MASWYESAPLVEEPNAPQGRVFIPNAAGQRNEQRDQTRTDIAVEGSGRDAARFDREGDKDTRQGMADLRKEFSALPEVKAYKEAATALDTGLFTKADGSGDGTLLYQYSKLMDPMGSVREGDVQLAQAGAGYLSAKAAELKKNFGIGGGGSLPPEIREGLRREMIGRFNSLNRAYNQRRQEFRGVASQAQYDPEFVIGEHAGAPFLERFRAYDEQNGATEQVGPSMLPRAAGAQDQAGADIGGVTPKGEGFRPEPQLYHLGNTVADMIAGGADVPQIREYLDEQYAPFGVGTSTPMMAKIGEVVQAHRANPSKPIKSLVPGWDNLHLIPDNAEPTIVGQIADSAAGAAALGVADIGTLGFGDEIAGAIGGDEMNAAWDYSRQERPGAYMAGQVAGGLLLPTGATGAARGAGTAALRAGEGMTAARMAASQAAGTRMAQEAGAYGLVHGAGSAEGDLSDRATGAIVEGGLGFLGGKALGAAGNKVVSNRMARAAGGVDEEIAGADNAAEYLAAAERQNITPFVGDVNTSAAALSGKLAQLQSSVGPITKAARKTLTTAQAARDRIARGIGKPEKGEALGHRIAEGARKAVTREHDQAQSLYKAAERQSENVRVRPSQAFQTISDEIDKITDTGGGSQALNVFKRYQDRMTQGPMSVETLRNVRTQIREDLATEGLRGGTANASARKVMEAITADIDSTLRAQGLGETADLFKRADESWAAYTELTDDVIAPLIGKNGEFSGEQVVKKLQADLRGNNARAAHLLRALPAEEQRIVRASVIRSMGHAPSGAQGADQDTFSLAKFLTHWDEIGDSAKEAYFGAEARSALNDLAKVADGAKQSQRWANHSNSAGGVNLPAEVVGGIFTLGGSVAVPNISARLLTSQPVVRWLGAAAKKPNPKALEAHVKRLASIADAEPALANEILGLQSTLQQQLSAAAPQSVGRAYAEEDQDSRKKKPAEGKRDDAQ